MATYYQNYVRGRIHSNTEGKKVYNRIESVENYDHYQKRVKIVSGLVFLTLCSSVVWVPLLIKGIVLAANNSQTIQAILSIGF